MELKPGYKQTEVGVIPEEWEVATAMEACELVVDCKNRTPPVVTESDFAVVRTPNVRDGRFILEDLRFTDGASYKIWTERATPQVGDIMITREAPLGEVCAVPHDRKVCLGQRMMLYRPSPIRTSSTYLLYSLMSRPVRSNLLRNIGGSTVGHAKVDDIRFLQLPLPPLHEQRAIATALGDVDSLLGALDRLIAKKRDLKQAAMQQLLTGQTRLPRFHGEWEETTLGAIGECIIGLTYKPENVVEHGLLVLRSSNIQNGRLAHEDNVYVNIKISDHLVTRIGDILICVRNGSRALIGKSVVIDESAVGLTFGAFMSVYRSKYWRFIAHAFQSGDIQRQIHDNIGATINQITNKDMKAFRVKLPPEDEQTAIAAVLTDMDAELAALEQRRDKTRALKQAMMQELLTGRTRLV